jgi:hypothetical protein
MSEKCDKGLILKIYMQEIGATEFRNVGIEVYEGLKRDLASGRPFIEFSSVIQKGFENCNKMDLIPTAQIKKITLEEPSTAEKEGRE